MKRCDFCHEDLVVLVHHDVNGVEYSLCSVCEEDLLEARIYPPENDGDLIYIHYPKEDE